LLQVKGIGEAVAETVVREREVGGPYRSLADFCARLVAHMTTHTGRSREAVEALVLAGAFDGTGIPRQRLWWLLGERWPLWSSGGRTGHTGPRRQTGRGTRKKAADLAAAQAQAQARLPWVWDDEQAAEAPLLPPLTLQGAALATAHAAAGSGA
jgi:DNA polymerase III alpha subunit